MSNMTTRTFTKTNTGILIALEDVQAAFLSRKASILLDSGFNTIDFLSEKNGDTKEHFKNNIKKLKAIGNVKNRLTLPDGGFIMINLIKTVVNSELHSSVFIIGNNDKVLYSFDVDKYSDLEGLLDAIQDTLIAISSNKNGRVDWSAYTKIATTQKNNSTATVKNDSQTSPLAPAK